MVILDDGTGLAVLCTFRPPCGFLLFCAGHPVQLEGHLAHILLPVVSACVALLVLVMLWRFLRRRRGMFASGSDDILRGGYKV